MHHTIVFTFNFYIALAIVYNLSSQLFDDFAKKKLAPTEPTTGVLIMAVVYLWFSLSLTLSTWIFAIGAVSFIYLIGRFGILKHLTGYSAKAYFSRASWLAAIGINIFGIFVLIGYTVAAIGTA